MTPDDIAALKQAFSESLSPIWLELKGIHELVSEQGDLLREHSKLLESIDNRLTNVEGILNGVEIMVRGKAG
jgi:hypothetical protein